MVGWDFIVPLITLLHNMKPFHSVNWLCYFISRIFMLSIMGVLWNENCLCGIIREWY